MTSDATPDSSGRPYRVRPCDATRARELASAVGLGPTTAQILIHRGIDSPSLAREFLAPTLSGLSSPSGMAGRDLAAERLARAVRARERIVVFGDYDVDGTTSAAILSDVLEALGGDVVAILADRFRGGYGLSEAALDRCLEASPSLLVTCDCGSSDHARVERARRAGVDVVVIDHHLVPREPLPALAFLNPHRPDCPFPYKGMASAGLAFSVGAAVRSALGVSLDVRPWLDLVALGTVADVAPLDGDNRRLVRAGLERIHAGRVRPGVQALLEVAGMRLGEPVGAVDIAFRLAPRINAPGRLGDPSIVLALLRARTLDAARALARDVEERNTRRRAVEQGVTAEAVVQALDVYGEHPETGIVVASPRFHRGVVGITAARLVERFGVPVVVVALEDGMGHGSARTPSGGDVHAALARSREALEGFGGHAAAAGMVVAEDRIDAFRALFADATRDGRFDRHAPPLVDLVLGESFPVPGASEVRRLEPLGEGNPSPRVAADARVVSARAVGEGKHLKLELAVGAARLSAFAPQLGARAAGIGKAVQVVGTLRPDAFRGGESVELTVDRLLPSA